MAKQCISCGRLLAKEDALICNECGRSQVDPANASGGAASSAIKVKLPPREFTRVDPPTVRQESSLPGSAASIKPPSSSQREQTIAPSSRMPKRPTRLTPSAEETSAPAAAPKADVGDDAFEAMTRLAGSVKPSTPTPAEEVSTMILPNWREELAQLRKEQEKTGANFTAPPEKPAKQGAQEPSAPGHRLPDQSPQRQAGSGSLQSRTPEKPLSANQAPDNRASRHATPPPDLPRKTPSRPLPRDVVRPAEAPRKTPSSPLPQENMTMGEPPRRELRVKVWEQEKTIQYPQVQAEAQEPGPAPAVEQNPLAHVAFGAEEQAIEIADLETAHWQTPLSPVPTSSGQPPARKEQRSEAKQEPRPPAREEKRLDLKGDGQPARTEKQAPPQEEEARTLSPQDETDIEDQPTMRLAVSEITKQEPQFKIERASTPAPKKWAEPPADEVEDLPTRPMAAAGPAEPRTPQQPARGIEQRGPVEASAPPSPRPAVPPVMPGGPGAGPLSIPQPESQGIAPAGDAPASRGRPAYPNAQPGPSFNPASLPPLPPGPISLAGNTQLRPEEAGMPGPQGRPGVPAPDPFSPRPAPAPAQRPPSFEPISVSSTPNLSIRDAGVGAEAKPRKKRRPGLVLVVLLLLVLAGGVAGYFVYNNYVAKPQDAQTYQAYQNNTLNISLHYTPGWSVNFDQAHSTIHFGDSTHTDQVNLSMAAVSGQVGDYLNQQATSQGVSSPKAAPTLSFAGTNWQALKGTVTQSGATFTIVLYAVEHSGHFYLLEFLAPQSSFDQADQSHFKQIRSSFSFV